MIYKHWHSAIWLMIIDPYVDGKNFFALLVCFQSLFILHVSSCLWKIQTHRIAHYPMIAFVCWFRLRLKPNKLVSIKHTPRRHNTDPNRRFGKNRMIYNVPIGRKRLRSTVSFSRRHISLHRRLRHDKWDQGRAFQHTPAAKYYSIGRKQDPRQTGCMLRWICSFSDQWMW